MPVLLLIGLCAGCLLGAATRMGRPTQVGCLLFGGTVVAPVGGALLVLVPDYALMYLADPRHGALWLAAFVLALGAPGACLLGGFWGERVAGSPWVSVLLVPFLGLGLLLGAGWRRAIWVGSYEVFHGLDGAEGALTPLVESALFVPVVAGLAAMAGVLTFSVLHLRRWDR